MKDTQAKYRMENIFVSYHRQLCRHGLKCIRTENQKVAVFRVLYAIRPTSLQIRLKSDLEFSHQDLQKDFTIFMNQ